MDNQWIISVIKISDFWTIWIISIIKIQTFGQYGFFFDVYSTAGDVFLVYTAPQDFFGCIQFRTLFVFGVYSAAGEIVFWANKPIHDMDNQRNQDSGLLDNMDDQWIISVIKILDFWTIWIISVINISDFWTIWIISG